MIIPVIHGLNWPQIKTNLEICQRNNINMVFLINHSSGFEAVEELKNWYQLAKSDFPQMLIGLNFLQLGTEAAIGESQKLGASAVWSDYPYDGSVEHSMPLFGAVAFKYQPHVADDQLEAVCHEAMTKMEVICTSGPGTGQPASIAKIQKIRSYIGNHPLAIASGVDVHNKKLFEPLVDYMLVASSITDKGELINETKLIGLLNA